MRYNSPPQPLSALVYISKINPASEVVFIHGPLQNSFETYDSESPNFIPRVNPDFLNDAGFTEEVIRQSVENLPSDAKGDALWNECIPVYVHLMKEIFRQSIPFIGVVERSRTNSFSKIILDSLVAETTITKSTRKQLWDIIQKNEIDDEFLFGCILDEGEFLLPVTMPKNFDHRAHDRWRLAISQMPSPSATMIKCSANSFPYRVEFNNLSSEDKIYNMMSLLYHTSLLLPYYAFPVAHIEQAQADEI